MCKKIKTAIEEKRKQLINKGKKKGIWENFGQTEIMELKDKFNYFDLVQDDPQAAKLIDDFEDFCLECDLNTLNQY